MAVEQCVKPTFFCDTLSGNGIGTEDFEAETVEQAYIEARDWGRHFIRRGAKEYHVCPHCTRGFFDELWVRNWDGLMVKASLYELQHYDTLPDEALLAKIKEAGNE